MFWPPGPLRPLSYASSARVDKRAKWSGGPQQSRFEAWGLAQLSPLSGPASGRPITARRQVRRAALDPPTWRSPVPGGISTDKSVQSGLAKFSWRAFGRYLILKISVLPWTPQGWPTGPPPRLRKSTISRGCSTISGGSGAAFPGRFGGFRGAGRNQTYIF